MEKKIILFLLSLSIIGITIMGVVSAGLLITIGSHSSVNITFTGTGSNASFTLLFPNTTNVSSALFNITSWNAATINTSAPVSENASLNWFGVNTYDFTTDGNDIQIQKEPPIGSCFGIIQGIINTTVSTNLYATPLEVNCTTATYSTLSSEVFCTSANPYMCVNDSTSELRVVHFYSPHDFAPAFRFYNWTDWSTTPNYASNLSIDIENDGDIEFQNLSESINGISVPIDNFTTSLNNYITSTCTTSTCSVPINISVNDMGKIEIHDIAIDYDAITYSPALIIDSIPFANTSTFWVTVINDENQNATVNISTDLPAGNFTLTNYNTSFQVYAEQNASVQINITAASAGTPGIYSNNLIITKANNYGITLPVTFSIGASVGDIEIIPASKTDNVEQDAVIDWSLNVTNQQSAILSNCNVSIGSTLSPYYTIQMNNETWTTTHFNISGLGSRIINMHLDVTPLSTSFSGTADLDIWCTATAEGGLDTQTIPITVNVAGEAAGGGLSGGGGGGTTTQIIITESDFQIIPPRVDMYYLYQQGGEGYRFELTANKEVSGCEIEHPFFCEVDVNKIILTLDTNFIEQQDKFTQVLDGLLKVTAKSSSEIIEVPIRISVGYLNAITVDGGEFPIITAGIVSGVIIIIVAVLYKFRKKIF